MLDFTAFLVAVGPIAIGITKLVDLTRNTLDKNDDPAWKWLWNVEAFALGILYALVTGSNFVALINGLSPELSERLGGFPGQVLTGIALGGVASFWHEQMDKKKTMAVASAPGATAVSASSE